MLIHARKAEIDCGLMKTIRILISLLLICLLLTSFGGQVVQAAAHPGLYFTQPELDNLKALKTAPSHQAIWNNIQSWADAHINDPPPAPGGAWRDWMKNKQKKACLLYGQTEYPLIL